MNVDLPFDDFIDECLLLDDSLCKYPNDDLDQVLRSLVLESENELGKVIKNAS